MLEKSNTCINLMSQYLSNYKLRNYNTKPIEIKNHNKSKLSTGKIKGVRDMLYQGHNTESQTSVKSKDEVRKCRSVFKIMADRGYSMNHNIYEHSLKFSEKQSLKSIPFND